MSETKDLKTIPKFRSYKEEALWWDNHDPLDYFDTSEMVKVESPKRNKEELLVIRVDANLKEQLIKDATRKGIGVSTQSRMILNEYYNRNHI